MWNTIRLTVIALAVSGCTTVVDTYCQNYTPTTYSAAKDTPETVRQIQENNAVWRRLCQ